MKIVRFCGGFIMPLGGYGKNIPRQIAATRDRSILCYLTKRSDQRGGWNLALGRGCES